MIKHFHYPDELFKSAYQTLEEMPSAAVWDDINASLDKVDAERYKRKFKQWKLFSLLLILFMGIFIIFESALIRKPGPAYSISNFEQRKIPIRSYDAIQPASKILNSKRNHLPDPIKTPAPKNLSVFNMAPELKEIGGQAFLSGVPEKEITGPVFSPPAPLIGSGRKAKDPATKADFPEGGIQKQTAFKKYWSLTGLASLDMAAYRIDNDLTHHDAKTLIEGRESHNASFSLGILADYQFSKKWAVQTGFRYSNILIGIDPHEIYAVQRASGNASYKYVTSSGYAFIMPDFQTSGDSLQTTSARHHLVFVSLPLMLQYRIVMKKWTLTPSAGLQINYLAKAAVKTEIHEGFKTEIVSINQLQGKKTLYLSYVAEAGLAYRMNSKWDLNAIPSFQYGVTSITRNNAVNTFPYSVGLSVGVTRHF